MSTGGIGGAGVGRIGQRPRQEEEDRKAFQEVAGTAAPALRESYISSIIAARQPPRLPLVEDGPESLSSTAALFASELDDLSTRQDTDIGAELATIFITHGEQAKASGDPAVAAAFDHLGEVMLTYEHLRLLRTGELG
ncbi:MAG: hypothetical protein AAF841_01060 [Pseudomonadota bacterium]